MEAKEHSLHEPANDAGCSSYPSHQAEGLLSLFGGHFEPFLHQIHRHTQNHRQREHLANRRKRATLMHRNLQIQASEIPQSNISDTDGIRRIGIARPREGKGRDTITRGRANLYQSIQLA